MINTNIQIQLLDQNSGLLDVLGDMAFPLNFGVADIRDISKRSGAFSKTITLAGTKNNARLLNNYFDINIEDGTFDVNKKQKCNVLQNGVVILSEGVFQLISVVKSQNILSEDDKVTYQAQIRDSAADFFTEINQKELTDLELVNDGHLYNAPNIVASFSHTAADDYKYVMPWSNDPKYLFNEFHPGIYAKTYWDLIHANAGYSYDWPTQADPNIQFDKLIIPFNGDVSTILKEGFVSENTTKVETPIWATTDYYANTFAPNTNNFGLNFQYHLNISPTAIDNPNGEWQSNEIFLPALPAQPPQRYDYNLDLEYEYYIVNPHSNPIFSTDVNNTGVRNPFSVNLAVLNLSQNQVAAGFVTRSRLVWNNIGIVPGLVEYDGDPTVLKFSGGPTPPTLAANSTTLFATGFGRILLQPSAFNAGDSLDLRIWNDVWDVEPWFYQTSVSGPYVGAVIFVRIKSVKLSIAPNPDYGYFLNQAMNLNDFIPQKVKQSDFIKSICTMYNLFCQPDPDEPYKLIYRTRDNFYDSGKTLDWTEKLDRSQDQEILFLPELTNKSIKLTYKYDQSDIASKAYTERTKKTYGQLRYTFKNEWVRGEDVKEIIFAPTLCMETFWGATLPYFENTLSPKTGLRCLLDNGNRQLPPGYTINIQDGPTNNSNQTTGWFPFMSHHNDPIIPTFDINFGVCEYYLGRLTPTENNLYYNHWTRTLQNIAEGKMLTAFFWLTEADINQLRLNDIVRIDNGYFYINRIIDYDASSEKLTKVELITVEQSAPLGINTGNEVKPYDPKSFVDSITVLPAGSGRGTDISLIKTQTALTRGLASLIDPGRAGNAINLGRGNSITPGFSGMIIGDNVATQEAGVYVGDWKLTGGGVTFTGIRVIDGGYDQVINLSKTTGPVFVDGGVDQVRNLNNLEGPAFIDGGRQI